MKVYCIQDTCDYVPRLKRIFSTLEKAEQYVAKYKEEMPGWVKYLYIEEVIVE